MRIKASFTNFLLGFVFMFAMTTPVIQADDTLWIPVIFYDYHADGSNPDFQAYTKPDEWGNKYACGYFGQRTYNIVNNSLDDNRRVTLDVASPVYDKDIFNIGKDLYNNNKLLAECHNNVSKWYIPSGADNTTLKLDTATNQWKWTNLVERPGHPNEWVGNNYDPSDKMANIIIYDSLPFVRDTRSSATVGTFIFEDTAFFALDGKGFGNEEWISKTWRNGVVVDSLTDTVEFEHNFSFAMELHFKFNYRGGEFFDFTGDDDVWVFINGKQAMDIGGIHAPVNDGFYLDSIKDDHGLKKGNEYWMDFYYAERKAPRSTIKITTNIITPTPTSLSINAPDTLVAGDTATLTGLLLDQFGEKSSKVDGIKWSIVSNKEDGDNVNPSNGKISHVTATKAGRKVTVKAVYEGEDDTITSIADITIIPDKIAEIRIQNDKGDDIGSDYSMDYAVPDAVTLRAVGYDKFGNKVKSFESEWSVEDGNLHDPGTSKSEQIFYTSENVEGDEDGNLYARYPDNHDIFDVVHISIDGPGIGLKHPITRDYDADGLLDAFELVFVDDVTFPDDYDLSDITIKHKVLDSKGNTVTVEWKVDSISPKIGTEHKSFILYVQENNIAKQPQTGWLPLVTFPKLSNNVLGVKNRPCIDGAAPVIWSVEKRVTELGDREQDKITITFSENIKDFDIMEKPSNVLNIWNANSDTASKIKEMLKGIDRFAGKSNNSVWFYMENGADLNARHFVNINTTDNPHISDKSGNKPDSLNHRVNVIVKGDFGLIRVGPNPLIPVFSHFSDVLEHNDNAFQWAKDEGGAVMVADFELPSEPNEVRARLIVFDAIGNAVYMVSNDDNVIPEEWKSNWVGGTSKQLVFYWNGITNQNRRAAPGIYRAILYIETDEDVKKFVSNMGIGR